MNTTEYRPEIWLLLSDLVDETVRAEPRDPDSLYQLRLNRDFPLVRRVATDRVVSEVRALKERGWRTIHLVFNPMDPQLLAELRPLVADDLDIQYHDWYRSPSNVLMSLGCPDMAISEALRAGQSGEQAATLTLAEQPTLPHDFHGRLIAALRDWETAARETHGQSFAEFYSPEEIEWDQVVKEQEPVLVSVPPSEVVPKPAGILVDLRRAARQALDRIAGVLDGAGARQGGGRFKAAGATFHADPAPIRKVNWTVADAQHELTVAALFTIDPVPSVSFHLRWQGAGAPPASVRLLFENAGWSLDLACSRWATSLDGSSAQTTMQVFADPQRALQVLLLHLNATQSPLTVELRDGSADAAAP